MLSEEAPAQAQAGLDGLKTFIDTLLLVTEAQAAAAPTSGADAPLAAPAPDAPAQAEQGAAANGRAAAGPNGAVAAPPAHAGGAVTMDVDRSPAPVSALPGGRGDSASTACMQLCWHGMHEDEQAPPACDAGADTPAASACRRWRRPRLPAPQVCR